MDKVHFPITLCSLEVANGVCKLFPDQPVSCFLIIQQALFVIFPEFIGIQ